MSDLRILMINGEARVLRPIDSKDVRLGMLIYNIERYKSGAELTFYGYASRIGHEEGWKYVDLRGVPHQGINGRKPESIELYEVVT